MGWCSLLRASLMTSRSASMKAEALLCLPFTCFSQTCTPHHLLAHVVHAAYVFSRLLLMLHMLSVICCLCYTSFLAHRLCCNVYYWFLLISHMFSVTGCLCCMCFPSLVAYVVYVICLLLLMLHLFTIAGCVCCICFLLLTAYHAYKIAFLLLVAYVAYVICPLLLMLHMFPVTGCLCCLCFSCLLTFLELVIFSLSFSHKLVRRGRFVSPELGLYW